MPFANFNTRWRFGIANNAVPDTSRWAKQVLRLPSDTFNSNFPAYQEQLAHRANSWEEGPSSAAAETCNGAQADTELGFGNVIRQISVHDTVFARRNTSSASTPNPSFALSAHSGAWYGQTYYLNNEPDFYSAFPAPKSTCINPNIPNDYTTNECCSGSCWDPRSTTVDTAIFPNSAVVSFWETRSLPPDVSLCTPAIANSSSRCRPDALAFVYLRLKRMYEGLSRGHSVLLPSAANPQLGADEPSPTSATPGYWGTFYNKVLKTGMSYGAGNSEAKITDIQKLKTLHFHYYTPPRGAPEVANMPLETVAEGAYHIRRGVEWFRTYYGGGNSLPLDILLSETGYLWSIKFLGKPKHEWWWGGGWNNFQSALSWWNTWLCWLMRLAPIECNLSGSTTGTYTDAQALYASIHEPYNPPYCYSPSFQSPEPGYWQLSSRNQWCFNSDSWAGSVAYSAEAVDVQQMVTSGRFQRSFSTFQATPWDSSSTWRIGPLGACYKVWAQVGADVITENLSTGWVTNFNAGQIAETQVNLPQGYSTVYFPIIKAQIGTAYAAGTQFSIAWRNGSQVCNFGYGDLSEFQDSKPVNQIYTGPISPTQSVISTMVYPVVCYASTARSVTVRLSRNFSGPRLAFGRPVVLPQACSWFINQ